MCVTLILFGGLKFQYQFSLEAGFQENAFCGRQMVIHHIVILDIPQIPSNHLVEIQKQLMFHLYADRPHLHLCLYHTRFHRIHK